MVKGRQNRNRIEAVEDVMGQRHIGTEVAAQFVNHFKGFLGVAVRVQPLTEASSLFTSRLNLLKAAHMVRPVSSEEIKLAMFDIGDNTAPGPDGYTSKFFKST